jgi:HEAT repeat protein
VKQTGGIPVDHWTRWWYANRTSLLDLHGRVRDRQVSTPSERKNAARTGDEMWREQAQEALTLALCDTDDDVVSGAAVALGKAGDPSNATPLLAVLMNPKRAQQSREGAALGLGLLTPEKGGADVRSALELVAADKSAPQRLRGFAVYALGLRGEAAALPFLLDAAQGPGTTWDVAAAGASAIGLSRCTMAREDLERMLTGPKFDKQRETMRRVYAAHGLARLGDPAAVTALRAVGLDDDPDVRRAVILALGALAPSDDAATAEYLAHALHMDKDRACRNMAAIAIARVGPERAEHELRWLYDNGDALEQPFAAIGLALVARRGHDPEIAKLLRHDLEERANSELRGALCIAVGLAGDIEAAPIVRKIAAERGDPEVRAQAAMALGLLGDRDGGPKVLRGLLRDPSSTTQREAAYALGMLGDREAVKLLLDLVEDGGSVYVQGSAAVALGRIGGAESVTSLTALLRDQGRPGIARAMAAVSLGLLLDSTEGRRLASIGADLDWYALTSASQEILDIL